MMIFLEEDIETFKKGQRKFLLLEYELHQCLVSISSDEFRGISYCREEIGWYQKRLCVVHGGKMHWNGHDLPAFRYRDSMDSKLIKIEKCMGSAESFRIAAMACLNPNAQIIVILLPPVIFHFEKDPIEQPCFVAVHQLRKYAVVLVDQ